MPSALSRLLEEHQVIRRLSSALEWLSIRFGSGSGVDEDFLRSLYSLLDFVSLCHHEREEEVLFPALSGLEGVPDLVNDAISDHREFSQLTQRLKDSIEAGDLTSASDAAAAASSLLKRHIEWEEAGLFATAEASLPSDVKESISKRLSEAGEGCSLDQAVRDLEIIYQAMGGG